MFKPNAAIDKTVEKLATAIGRKTSRRGFLDRLGKALLSAGAGTFALLASTANGATPALDACTDYCLDIWAQCIGSCNSSCPGCNNCCGNCVQDCYASCQAIGIPSECPVCCGS